MTKPHYPMGCLVRSKVRELASSSLDPENEDYARNVNFNNGNSNINNRNNTAFVLAVRGGAVVGALPGEYQGAGEISFRDLYDAWQRARKQKQLSANQLRFEARWIDGLLDLRDQLNAGTWKPRPTACFIAQKPKAREIHAPDFADRVVHHWLVPQLERLYEPVFIADSFANRKGKGTHAAVDRLQGFVRQVHSGQGGGFFLQMDIRNCFNEISRLKAWQIIKAFMQRRGVPEIVQRTVHALLRESAVEAGVHHRSTVAERAAVPPHKRLENAEPGCGLAIGNLWSQFLCNVYLNELDQFVKHELGAKRYLRYVDDFVLVHQSLDQLVQWQARIEQFLQQRLGLCLKAGSTLAPITQGIDFLGYVTHPTHRLVRRRVVQHAHEALWHWQQRHVDGDVICATPIELKAVASVWQSYQGHFSHANAFQLRQNFHRRYPWLHAATGVRRQFNHRAAERPITIKVY